MSGLDARWRGLDPRASAIGAELVFGKGVTGRLLGVLQSFRVFGRLAKRRETPLRNEFIIVFETRRERSKTEASISRQSSSTSDRDRGSKMIVRKMK